MTGTQGFRSDDEHLADRLRRLDPARGVAPLTEHRIEEIMSNSTVSESTRDAKSPEHTTKGRRSWRPFAAVVAAAGAAAAIVTAVVVAQPSGGGSTLALSLPDAGGAVSSACAPIAAEFVAGSDVAFEGRVTGIDGSTVTLEVLHQYTGETTSTVEIPQADGTTTSELSIEPLEVGGTYLISATNGVVATCGQSGPSTPELKAVYEEAFS